MMQQQRAERAVGVQVGDVVGYRDRRAWKVLEQHVTAKVESRRSHVESERSERFRRKALIVVSVDAVIVSVGDSPNAANGAVM